LWNFFSKTTFSKNYLQKVIFQMFFKNFAKVVKRTWNPPKMRKIKSHSNGGNLIPLGIKSHTLRNPTKYKIRKLNIQKYQVLYLEVQSLWPKKTYKLQKNSVYKWALRWHVSHIILLGWSFWISGLERSCHLVILPSLTSY